MRVLGAGCRNPRLVETNGRMVEGLRVLLEMVEKSIKEKQRQIEEIIEPMLADHGRQILDLRKRSTKPSRNTSSRHCYYQHGSPSGWIMGFTNIPYGDNLWLAAVILPPLPQSLHQWRDLRRKWVTKHNLAIESTNDLVVNVVQYRRSPHLAKASRQHSYAEVVEISSSSEDDTNQEGEYDEDVEMSDGKDEEEEAEEGEDAITNIQHVDELLANSSTSMDSDIKAYIERRLLETHGTLLEDTHSLF
ncbi:hypothetical protein BT63DRAFT_411024 [Microthyrium microscopicum]|uniref:Uncharacterized protein n=1 Tax=Microthyrium microscopicum TaxID=703497 RepID=A0A6A6UL84_9PEZI|nr:hypothetical protein BT63DRAFT_411024 [Microthyrium microscopicum]